MIDWQTEIDTILPESPQPPIAVAIVRGGHIIAEKPIPRARVVRTDAGLAIDGDPAVFSGIEGPMTGVYVNVSLGDIPLMIACQMDVDTLWPKGDGELVIEPFGGRWATITQE